MSASNRVTSSEGPPEAVAPAVLDPQALANLAVLDPGGSSRLVQRVLSTYHASLARLMAQLQAARGGGDLATVRLVAHTLKSSSASIGAMEFSALCAAAEQAVREERTDDLAPMLARLQDEAARVDAAVQALLTA